MPIYEYECRACGHEFEQLIRTGDTAACPECKSQDLERLISLLTVSSDATRQANIQKARQAGKRIQRDKTMADADEIREHYGDEIKAFRETKRAEKAAKKKA
jgi:putative FmdB family regulatory protein